jgi:hypothetical protein
MDILEPVWNGALERSGLVAGLSSYDGKSSLFHSPAYTPDTPDEVMPGRVRGRNEDRKRRARPGEHDAEALRLLRNGLSYYLIARKLDCSEALVRSVARRHGLCRRSMSNHIGHRL